MGKLRKGLACFFMEKTFKQLDNLGFVNRVQITATKGEKVTHQTGWMKNKVVSSADNGRNLILQALSGDYVNSLEITHCELGTGTTAAADADTETETFAARAQQGYVSVVGDELSIKFFFSTSLLPDDTYNELTMWINGAAGEGTGHLFNHLVYTATPYVKATGEDTTVEIKVTLNG